MQSMAVVARRSSMRLTVQIRAGGRLCGRCDGLEVVLAQRFRAHGRRRLHHEVVALVRLGESDHVAEAGGVGEQRHQPVKA